MSTSTESGSWPSAPARAFEAGDVTVVVGTEDVDQVVETALVFPPSMRSVAGG